MMLFTGLHTSLSGRNVFRIDINVRLMKAILVFCPESEAVRVLLVLTRLTKVTSKAAPKENRVFLLLSSKQQTKFE